MTAPPYTYLQIRDETLDDLLSALRRHHRDDCQRLLAAWADDDCNYAPYRHLDDPLTAWVHAEAMLHVDDGRFEHALCLVEQYRPGLTTADMHRRITPSPLELL